MLLLSRIVFVSLTNAPLVPGSTKSVQIMLGESFPEIKLFNRFSDAWLNVVCSALDSVCD